MCVKFRERLELIRRAYDRTVEQYREGGDPYCGIPGEFRSYPGFADFMAQAGQWCNSGVSANREYLGPRTGMRFLDTGCCANLAAHHLDRWPSTCYGVDISPALIDAMKGYAERMKLAIGGLWVADISNLPFDADSFDISAVIGVLEYYSLDYIELALSELHRVLKRKARTVLDIPNPDHPHVGAMMMLEKYLDRPIILHARASFERALHPLFDIEGVDESQVMIKYFMRTVS